MPIDTLDNCPHERRPGTTVCLHCRHEALQQLRARRRDLAARLVVIAAAVGVLGVIVSAGAAAWRTGQTSGTTVLLASVDEPSPSREEPRATAPDADRSALAAAPAPSRDSATAVPATPVSTTPVAASAPAASPAPVPAVPPLAPALPEGRSELPDSLYARRTGDIVTVHFDTPATRTRRPEKFERIVRATLPLVYGPRMDSLLATIPAGAIAGAGELLTELPAKGLRLPAADGWWLELRPSTRPGEDGPLVVTYRVRLVR